MANTIQLKLLANKRIECYVNGYPYSYEGGYRIVAGEKNATIFKIISVPLQYQNASYSVTLKNSAGKIVPAPVLDENKSFTLPAGMAIAGYGSILITAIQGNETIVWTPLKIKIWETDPNYNAGVQYLPSPIKIGTVNTLPPGSSAIVENVGTEYNPILNFSIPAGQNGKGFFVTNTTLSLDNGTVNKSEIISPEGFSIDIGDLILDSVGNVVRVTAISEIALDYEHFTILSGGGTSSILYEEIIN